MNDPRVGLTLKGRENTTFYYQEIRVKDLEFNYSKGSSLCDKHLDRKNFHRVIQIIKSLINSKHILIGGFMFIVVNIAAMLTLLVVKLISLALISNK